MEKYTFTLDERGNYNITHNDYGGSEKQTWIAATNTTEKAHFICMALNSFHIDFHIEKIENNKWDGFSLNRPI